MDDRKRRYKQSAKGKAANKRYRQGAAGKAANRRSEAVYNRTEAGKARSRRYQQSEHGRAHIAAYKLTPARQETLLAYSTSAKRKAAVNRNRYKLTQADLDRFAAQNGLCTICGKQLPLDIDHRHEPHQVRDLLCRKHNLMIASLESPDRTACDEYLAKWNRIFHDTYSNL